MNIKNICLVCLFVVLGMVSAQARTSEDSKDKKEVKKSKWEQFMDDKKAFMIKEVGLTEEQQNELFPLYEKMCKEKFDIQKVARDKRNIVKKAKNEATEAQYIEAANAQNDADLKEAQLEIEYVEKFTKFLTPKQIYKLVYAEHKFTKEMMEKSIEAKYRKQHDKK